jgi:hypothetical protein
MNNSFISERREIIEAKLYVNSHLMVPSEEAFIHVLKGSCVKNCCGGHLDSFIFT